MDANDQREFEEAQAAWEAANESRIQSQLDDEATERTRQAVGLSFEELESQLYGPAILRRSV